ncbi:glycosyltransferase family 2 protein [Kyrpidia spormannii]|uniref:Glycosyltransferase n=2 Tax=Kyrpidia spormannii TaxID=2055160 RepID=A0ACA8Z6W1_9BACL|nr:glycosyltransferase family 2 protein [Kyrpidia spormannii]CAB3389563.1 putative Glycosyltransferase [Kyrpidia spormannii]CAB3390416.1 Glycosyltransferase [Kyrpidia spormannii]
MIKVSLVLATVNRIDELKRFLSHLSNQNYSDLELIVVDQNRDDRLVPLVKEYEQFFHIVHIRSAKGLSRARNVGLKYVTGEIIAFPDDDCWYPDGLLAKIAAYFIANPDYHGLLVASVDPKGRRTMVKGEAKPVAIDRRNVLWTAVSYTMFFRRDAVKSAGGFDEGLGVGADTPWGAGEETDYVLRMLKKGNRLWYTPDLAVVHPQSEITLQRAYSYGLGGGRVIARHYPSVFFWGYIVPRAFLGVLYALARGKRKEFRMRWVGLRARIVGWLRTRRELATFTKQ